MARGQPPSTLTVLTYNVYAGPPLPCSSGRADSLDGSPRLAQQAEALLALKPDIICLQEVLADGARRAYVGALGEDYDACYARDSSARRRLLQQCRLVSLAVLCLLPGYLACHSQGAAGMLVPTALAGWACRALTKTTAWGFACGDTHPAGLMILTRRSRLRQLSPPTACPFAVQQGDWMNVLRPRGVLWQQLELIEDGSTVWVGNAHADALSKEMTAGHGQLFSVVQPSSHRCAQLRELFEQGLQHQTGRAMTGGVVERLGGGGAQGPARLRVLVAGDFNTGYAGGELADHARCGFVDAWRVAHGGAGGAAAEAARGRYLSMSARCIAFKCRFRIQLTESLGALFGNGCMGVARAQLIMAIAGTLSTANATTSLGVGTGATGRAMTVTGRSRRRSIISSCTRVRQALRCMLPA